MNKRPLCFVGIGLICCIWLGEMLGITHFRDPRPAPQVKQLLLQETVLTVTGQVYQFEEKESCVIYYLKSSFLVRSGQSNPLKNIRVICDDEVSRYPMGSYLQITGELQQVEKAQNPGQFDARSYYAARNIEYQMFARSVHRLESSYDALAETGYRIRFYLYESLKNLVSAEKAGVFAAMLLGDKSGMDEEWKLRFQSGGISHILAISGLHLSLLGMGLFGLLCRFYMPIPIAAVLSGIILTLYSFLTGASISAIRALVMFLAAILAKVLGRTYDMLSALALAAMIAVLSCPASVFDCSFLLSYSAVLGIGILVPVMETEKKVKEKDQKMKKMLTGGLRSGVAVFLVTTPITLYFFYEISAFGIILNLLVLPTVGVVLVSGLAGSLCGVFSCLLGKIMIFPGSVLLGVYDSCCSIMTQTLMGNWILGRPDGWEIAVYYGILLVVYMIWKRQEIGMFYKGMVCGALMLAFCLLFVWQPNAGLKITFLNVGQGDCAVITSGKGHTYVIDGGSSDEEGVGQYRILPYLKYCGIRQVDYMLISHTDQDHTSGLVEIMDMIAGGKTSLRVKYLLLPAWKNACEMEAMQQLEEAGKAAGCQVVYVQRGDCISEEELQWTCLHPGMDDRIDYVNQTNAGSQVWMLETAGFLGLFTGDVEGEGEELLVKELGHRKVNVLKVAHHGSKNSTSEEFLEQVKPEIAVISAGENNLYGHPHEETLERLGNVGCKVYSTQEWGAVMIWPDEEKWIMTFHESENGV